jgi:hypothetical protein
MGKVAQCKIVERTEPFSKSFKRHGMVQRLTSRIFHFRDQSFAASDGKCVESLRSDWRWKTPTADLGTNGGLNLGHVIFLTNSKQV